MIKDENQLEIMIKQKKGLKDEINILFLGSSKSGKTEFLKNIPSEQSSPFKKRYLDYFNLFDICPSKQMDLEKFVSILDGIVSVDEIPSKINPRFDFAFFFISEKDKLDFFDSSFHLLQSLLFEVRRRKIVPIFCYSFDSQSSFLEELSEEEYKSIKENYSFVKTIFL